jgi:hypothetical protein
LLAAHRMLLYEQASYAGASFGFMLETSKRSLFVLFFISFLAELV